MLTTAQGLRPAERPPGEPWRRTWRGGRRHELMEWGEYEPISPPSWSWSSPAVEAAHPWRGPQLHVSVYAAGRYGRGRYKLRASASLTWDAIRLHPEHWRCKPRSLRAARRWAAGLDVDEQLRVLLGRAFQRGEHLCVYRVVEGEQPSLEPLCTTLPWVRGFNVATDDLPQGKCVRLHPRGSTDVVSKQWSSTCTSMAPTLEQLVERQDGLTVELLAQAERWGDPEAAP